MTKKIMMSLMLILLTSSLPIKTIHANDIPDAGVVRGDRPIQKGEPAAYDGFLTPRPKYLEYTGCMDQLPKCEGVMEKFSPENENSTLTTIVTIVLTFIATDLVCHAAHC